MVPRFKNNLLMELFRLHLFSSEFHFLTVKQFFFTQFLASFIFQFNTVNNYKDTQRAQSADLSLGQMSYFAMLTKMKNNLRILPVIQICANIKWLLSWPHATQFHQVSGRSDQQFSVILPTDKPSRNQSLLGRSKNKTNQINSLTQPR